MLVFDAAVCLVQSEGLFLTAGRIVPVQVVAHGVCLGFGAGLALETGTCCWLGLHGPQVASAWHLLLLHPLTRLTPRAGISGVLCLVRLRGVLACLRGGDTLGVSRPCCPENRSCLRVPYCQPWVIRVASLFSGPAGLGPLGGHPLGVLVE